MRTSRVLAAIALVLALAGAAAAAGPDTATGPGAAADFLSSRQQADGGFAERGRASDPALTAWVVLGLTAAGRPPAGAADYLAGKPFPTATDLELRILALAALGRDVSALADRLDDLRRPNGRIGPLVNSTIWGVLATRAAGRPVPAATVAFLVRAQTSAGGWGWQTGVKPDADDTAAAVQALVAAGVARDARPIRRALAFLRRHQVADGGFELEPGKGANAQSTAWAIQAFLAAGVDPGRRAFAYLARLQRADGSVRFSSRYGITPVWVTSYALVALAREPFPLR